MFTTIPGGYTKLAKETPIMLLISAGDMIREFLSEGG